MNSILDLLQSVFYPFWYFFVLYVVYEAVKIVTVFFVNSGRLKSSHAIENYWIYVLLTVFCVLTGVLFGYGDLLKFLRWSLCPLFAGLIGIHFGYEKGLAMSDEELAEIEDEADQMD